MLTEKEKKSIAQFDKMCGEYYYYDNPGEAVEDIEYLVKIVKRLNAELETLKTK
jgi:hypothetical protein